MNNNNNNNNNKLNHTKRIVNTVIAELCLHETNSIT